ncbi:MAG: CapA family protein [Candidatus Gastranaerophilales bacterium]|nr:CapA family protein [Candidatus Gastranaerophilales bacterium]
MKPLKPFDISFFKIFLVVICLFGTLVHPQPAKTQTDSFTIDLSIIGDCLLATEEGKDSNYSFSWYAKNRHPEYFFQKVSSIFQNDDFTIANLENVLTDRPLKNRDKGEGAFCFKAPSKNTDILNKGYIDIVSITNNHTYDYGKEGYLDTIQALNNAKILWGSENKTIYLNKNGYTIAFIPASLYNSYQTRKIIDNIKIASSKSDYQIVYFHGGKEGIYEPETWKINACHKLVDAGADLVIGNHPHRLQPLEIYKNVNIIYSLGNFCFGGNNHMVSNRTIIYKTILKIKDGKLVQEETCLIPCYVQDDSKYQNNWQPDIIKNEEERKLVIDFLFGKTCLPHAKTGNSNSININNYLKNRDNIQIDEESGYILKHYPFNT